MEAGLPARDFKNRGEEKWITVWVSGVRDALFRGRYGPGLPEMESGFRFFWGRVSTVQKITAIYNFFAKITD